MSCQLPTPSALMTLALWLFSDIPNSAHLRVSALALSSAWNASPPCSVTASFLTLTPHLQGQFFREGSLLLMYLPLPGAQSLWDIVISFTTFLVFIVIAAPEESYLLPPFFALFPTTMCLFSSLLDPYSQYPPSRQSLGAE